MNLSIKQLISEEQCYETIRQLRWSDKVRCPHCDSEQIIKRGKHSHQIARSRYECKACGKRFDDLTGTVLAGHHQSLSTWIMLVLHGLKPIECSDSTGTGLKQRRLTVHDRTLTQRYC